MHAKVFIVPLFLQNRTEQNFIFPYSYIFQLVREVKLKTLIFQKGYAIVLPFVGLFVRVKITPVTVNYSSDNCSS